MKIIVALMGCAMLIAAGLPFSKAQAADGLVLSVDRAFNEPIYGDVYRPKIIVSLKNESQRGYSMVKIHCRWLKDGKAQEVEDKWISNLPAQQTASADLRARSMFDYDSVSCRIGQVI